MLSEPQTVAPERDFARLAAIEEVVERSWEKLCTPELLARLRDPWRSSVLPTLRARVLSGEHSLDDYGARLRWMMDILERLFFAVHATGDIHDPEDPEHPRGFWAHQRFNLFRIQDTTRGIAPDKQDLAQVAATYLSHPELRTSKLDWLLMDAIVFAELEAYARELFLTHAGVGTNWAAIFAPREELKYYALTVVFWVLDLALSFGVPLGLIYYFQRHAHPTAAIVTAVLAGISMLFRLATAPRRWKLRRENRKRLELLHALYELLGEATISPRRVREALDAATAHGVAIEGAVFTILDRATARDATALIPSQVG